MANKAEAISGLMEWDQTIIKCNEISVVFCSQLLKLDANDISFIEELAFVNTSLETLYLNNKVTEFPLFRTNSNPSDLRYLDVKNNRITNIPVDQVEHLGLLRYLEISGNLFLEIYFIRYIPGLRSVFLSQNPFPSTNILPVEARNLEILVLTKNRNRRVSHGIGSKKIFAEDWPELEQDKLR